MFHCTELYLYSLRLLDSGAPDPLLSLESEMGCEAGVYYVIEIGSTDSSHSTLAWFGVLSTGEFHVT